MSWRTVTLTEIYLSRRRNVSKQVFLWPTSYNNGNKNKNKQVGPNWTLKILHSKGNYKQGEKTTLRIR